VQLIPEAVDQPRRDLAKPVAPKETLQVAEPPLIVIDGVFVETKLLGAPPALGKDTEALVDMHAERRHRVLETVLARLEPRRNPRSPVDLLRDPLRLQLGAGPVPALLVGAERDLLVATVGAHLCAVADRLAICPRALEDVPNRRPGHQATLLKF
jgi:hypothetical protein